jgi:hypothetical protein
LSYFHCGEKLQVDFKGLIEKSRAVNQINRISTGMIGNAIPQGRKNGD